MDRECHFGDALPAKASFQRAPIKKPGTLSAHQAFFRTIYTGGTSGKQTVMLENTEQGIGFSFYSISGTLVKSVRAE